MAVCTFDMQFTYVLTGWEGSTIDSHVLKNTLTRQDRLSVPEGDELGGGGDEVPLASANDDEDSDDSDGLVDEDNQSINIRRQHVLESARAAQYRDAIVTRMWNDH
ncbi:uncharacterized protein [Aristolochia californica]|uniref:uncharacterized protein n=1 Tax=Aristolochia californica TaxID=171875 RepID=UPI0035D7F31F